MQTTNSGKTGDESRATIQRSATVIKRFAGLAVAVLDSQIDEFALMVRKGIDTWRTAGKLLIEMSSKDPSVVPRIRERSGLSDSVIQTFCRIGRNEIWPPLLADNSLGAQKLLGCHYDDQMKYATEPIEVAIEWKGGKIKTAKLPVSKLSRFECAIVFAEDGKIRNLEQQAFRLREPEKKTTDNDPNGEPVNKVVRMVNVDIGYFSVVQSPDGKVTCEPCGKSPVAQPVRVIPNGKGFRSAIVLYYKQEMR